MVRSANGIGPPSGPEISRGSVFAHSLKNSVSPFFGFLDRAQATNTLTPPTSANAWSMASFAAMVTLFGVPFLRPDFFGFGIPLANRAIGVFPLLQRAAPPLAAPDPHG